MRELTECYSYEGLRNPIHSSNYYHRRFPPHCGEKLDKTKCQNWINCIRMYNDCTLHYVCCSSSFIVSVECQCNGLALSYELCSSWFSCVCVWGGTSRAEATRSLDCQDVGRRGALAEGSRKPRLAMNSLQSSLRGLFHNQSHLELALRTWTRSCGKNSATTIVKK